MSSNDDPIYAPEGTPIYAATAGFIGQVKQSRTQKLLAWLDWLAWRLQIRRQRRWVRRGEIIGYADLRRCTSDDPVCYHPHTQPPSSCTIHHR